LAHSLNSIKKFNYVMNYKFLLPIALIIASAMAFSGCGEAKGSQVPPPPQSLPVLAINSAPATTYQEFPATIEGRTNVEIRAQVDGYLDKIYAEEGSYVVKGQPLFKINDRSYGEQANNAEANTAEAKANLEKADIEVKRLEPLVQDKVVSDVQLHAAKASYEAAKAAVNRAQAAGNNAGINLGYTLVKAPVSGFIGRIPYKTGSLVGRNETSPLTIVSDVNEVYAYFSMSESDFLHFTQESKGKTIAEKIKSMPAVQLQLADKSIYHASGRIELMEGQFDKNMGTISFRAVFPNADGLIRSGSTGRLRIPRINSSSLPVPQTSTFELQDKVYVFALGDSNKVSTHMLHIIGKTTSYYLVDKGLTAGDKIVFAGMDRLADGAVISPQVLSADSVRQLMPL